MKVILFLFCVTANYLTLLSQPYDNLIISDGEMAHDFNIYAMNSGGNWAHLYEYLDKGKTVYLYFFETSDPVAWEYHTSNVMQNFNAIHGPNGDSTAVVIAVSENGSDDLNGFDPSSQGNWMYYLTYPLISELGYYKNFGQRRVIRICPDRGMFEMGLPDSSTLVQSLGLCEHTSAAIDTKVHYSHSDTVANCPGEYRTASAMICNMGSDTLYSTDVVVGTDNDIQETYHWEGALATYQIDTITFNDVALNGLATDLKFYTTMPNGSIDQNTSNDTLHRPLQGVYYWDSDQIEVQIQTDGYGHQIYWDITASNGTVIDSGGNVELYISNGNFAPSSPATQYWDDTYYEETISLNGYNLDCVTLRVLSGYGYGTCCTWGNGYIKFIKNGQVIFNYTDFGRRAYAKILPTFNLQPLEVAHIPTHVVDNASTGSITFEPSNGVPPYQHSIDCGQTFNFTSLYSGLSAGVYCVHTKDHIGNLVIDSVEILNTDSLTMTNTVVGQEPVLMVQPNPAKDVIAVTIMGTNLNEVTEVFLVDAIGSPVGSYLLYPQNEVLGTTIDISKLPDGIYMVYAIGVKATKVVIRR